MLNKLLLGIIILGSIFYVTLDKSISSAANARTCKEWLASPKISEYDNQFEKALAGEPEELMGTLQQIIIENQQGDNESVKKLVNNVKGKVSALKGIDPPDELEKVHGKLIKYVDSVEKAVDAVLRENISLQSTYTRTCYEMLLDYFNELKSIMIEKECDQGDIDALVNTIIPGIKNILNTHLSEEAIQKAHSNSSNRVSP